jgi:hypothetical protein
MELTYLETEIKKLVALINYIYDETKKLERGN